MTVQDAIDWVDRNKPNAFTDAEKVAWLNQLEGSILAEVMLLHPVEIAKIHYTTTKKTDELVVDSPYDDLYLLWLGAKIDLENGETDRYQNSAAVFNARWNEFVCWFAQTYDPAQGYVSEEAERYV